MTGSADALAETARVRRVYEASAERYDRAIALAERLLLHDGRQWACRVSRGAVLELGVGTGRNLPFYAAEISLTGIELSPAMVALARQRAHELGRSADLRVGDAQALDFPDASFDTVVCTMVLCTIPDERRAVAEAARVLRPGGRLVALEHVRSHYWAVRAAQRLLDPLAVRAQADHLLREPIDAVLAAGLQIEAVERRKWGLVQRLVARKPPAPPTAAVAR